MINMLKKNKSIIPNIVIFVLSMFFFIISFTIKLTNIDKLVGSRLLPQAVTILLMVFSLCLIISDIMKNKVKKPDNVKSDENSINTETEQNKPNYLNTILVFASFALYLILLQLIGFIISTIFYLCSQMYILAPKQQKTLKNIFIYAAVSIFLSIAIYWVFGKGFQLVLPRGILI